MVDSGHGRVRKPACDSLATAVVSWVFALYRCQSTVSVTFVSWLLEGFLQRVVEGYDGQVGACKLRCWIRLAHLSNEPHLTQPHMKAPGMHAYE